MMKYVANAITNLVGGNLELDEDQLRRRRHLVTDNGDGTFAIKKSVQFKRGEEFGYDGEIPRGLAESLIELVDEPAIEYPVHRGRGVYELSNGDKVEGKKNAKAAEANLIEVGPEGVPLSNEAED